MADDCISVQFENGDPWTYCWEDGHPDPSWKSENVTTGLRPSQGSDSRAWRTCQYYLKGMSAICEWWKEGAPGDKEGTTTSGSFFCSFKKANTSDNPQDPPPETPTGYNSAQCDFLGRRQWCSKYEGSTEDNLDEWICTAPNPYLTGLGKKSMGDEAAIFTPVVREDIWGFNDKDDGTGTGQCDCYGMGRGAAGCKVVGDHLKTEKNLSELPIVCNFYRPYQMGFGVIKPSIKRKGDVEADGVTITDQGWKNAKEWEDYTEYRLPLNYELYNWRAKFQKCQWWNEDTGRDFYTDTQGYINLDGENDVFDEATGKVEFCKCTDSAADDFNHRTLTSGSPGYAAGSQFALDAVWARGGGAVCNGARPECPCYSGKWKFLSGEKMLPGMPVTANQILELRFWSQDWDNQDDYDRYYEHKPNFDDPETAAIYTFTKWDKANQSDPSQSKMKGKKLTLCQPAPLHHKEFTLDYIKSEDLFYYNKGIGTSTESDQRQFPSLVRDPNFPELKPLVVTYPYYNDDAFDAELCKEQGPAGNVKRHNNIYGDAVKTVGQTIRDKTVYVINTSEVPVGNIFNDFSGVYNVKASKESTKTVPTIKNEIYNTLREVVSMALEKYPDYIKKTRSDTVFGYFLIDSIKLRYNQPNHLLVCVDYGDGTWEYRKRQVNSEWCGGVIKQTEYKHQYGDAEEGYTNSQPTAIGWAEAAAKITTLGGSATADVHSTFSLYNEKSGIGYYSYSIQEITNEESLEIKWGAVGNTNKIWVELTDININYVYDWDVESAELRVVIEEEEDDLGNTTTKPARGDDEEQVITLKKILVDDNHIPPNACLFEPADSNVRIRFLNSEWELYITYKYKHLINSGEELENVTHGAYKDLSRRYSDPYQIEQEGSYISFEGINQGSVQLAADFKDRTGRIISSFATKLLVNIIREGCRGVDIFYAYKAQGRKYLLMPRGGFCINIAQDFASPDPFMHGEAPDCGDHQVIPWRSPGPLWFPFNACRGYDMYDEWTICNNCQAGYMGPMNDGVLYNADGSIALAGGQVVKRKDYRYCGPYKYHAFAEVRGNWAASCDCGCKFSYSDASSATVIFAGYGRRKAPIDVGYYKAMGWALPPFGNEGRELVEKYISQDYVNHPMRIEPYIRDEWMPMVLDHSVFFSTFNAYDDNPEDEYLELSEYYSLEPFRYVNQLNMGLNTSINEVISQEKDDLDQSTGVDLRFRWEELFEVHHEGNCSYPYPRYPVGNVTKALFYYFKKDWHAWAWQEGWKDLERNVDGDLPETLLDPEDSGDSALANSEEEVIIDTGKLDFLELIRPLYIFDTYKTEHRRIMDEGKWIVEYRGPRIDEEGNMTHYPFLVFYGNNATFRKPFEIMYPENSYTSANVTWAKEGGQVATEASAAKDNPYELTGGSKWIHHQDTLFDYTAVSGTEEAKAAGREVVSSVDGLTGVASYQYFNRGLIANITRDRLYYLPKRETGLFYSSDGIVSGVFEDVAGEISISTVSTKEYENKNSRLIPGSFVWEGDTATITSESDGVWSFLKLRINGNWGQSEGLNEDRRPEIHTLVMPGVSLTCTFEDESTGIPRSSSVGQTELKEPEDGQEVETYDIYLEFMLGPVEMLNKRTTEFNINFTGVAGSYISINEIELVKADYVDIRYEYINVWERKYIASEFTDVTGKGINLDGPGDHLHYQEDRYNAGQYFRFRGGPLAYQEVAAVDKTKVVSCGLLYTEDESVADISYGNLHSIEKLEQRSLYEYAYDTDPSSDSVIYSSIAPYKYRNFLNGLGIRFAVGELKIISEKLPWEKHTKYKQFKQYDYWRPGGHYYKWSDTFTRERCMVFGGTHDVFQGYYAHVDHQGIGTPLEQDASKPIDPGNSYYSLRFYVQQAKYDRAMILAGGDPEYSDKWASSTPFNAGTFVQR